MKKNNSIITLQGASRTLAGFGVLLFLVDVVLRVGSTITLDMVLAEGQPFDGPPEQSTAAVGEKPPDDLILPHIAFAPLKIVPEYGATGKRTATKAKIRILGDNPRDLEISEQDDVVVDRVRVHLQDVGLAPKFAIRRSQESEPFAMVVNLNVWGPTMPEDTFRISDPPATVWVRFYPDFQKGPEGPSSLSMAPRNPVLHIRVVPDDPKEESGEAFLPSDGVVSFGSNSGLSVVELRHWGLFKVTETRGNLFLFLSLLAIALGWSGGLVSGRLELTQVKSSEAAVS